MTPTTPKDLPREVQSDLHDMVDELGERVAMGELVDISYEIAGTGLDSKWLRCTCRRYSQADRYENIVNFRYETDADCQYDHLQPLPMDHSVRV